jgi:uncharacterized SAM-binding protein YcdF (DUF218 family)
MIVLKIILKSLIVPPGIFIVLLSVLNIWDLITKKKERRFYSLIIAFLVWLLSISPISNSMLSYLESGYTFPKTPRSDVIILLGERFLPKVHDISGIGTPSGLMLARIMAAAKLQRNINVPIIISHGRKTKNNVSESLIAKRYLIELGVPVDMIIFEGKSRDTYENAKYSKELCKKFGFQNPIIVTSAYHLKRAMLSFKKIGMTVNPFPSNFLSSENRKYQWNSFLPGYENSRNSSIAIKEYFGLFFYNFFY